MKSAGIVENLQQVLEKEGKRISSDVVIRESVQMVEKLESSGAIDKVKYRLPLTDTIGRNPKASR
jgi:hypothetical protein